MTDAHESWESAQSAWFSAGDEAALSDFWRVHEASLQSLLLLDEAGRQLIGRLAGAWGPRSGVGWSQLVPSLLASHELLAAQGVDLSAWTQACLRLQAELTPRLIDAHAAEPARLEGCLRVLQRYAARTLETVASAICGAQDHLLELQRGQLEQATARFTRLAESGILGILICDFQGNITEANDSFLNTFGYSREDLAAGAVGWATMTPPEWKHLDDVAIEQLRATGKSHPWEKEYFHQDGSRVPVHVGVATLNDTQTIAFVLDISERKRLEEIRKRTLDLETQNRRILEASRLKSEFLANMSHELRTPLNSILGFTELLHDGEIEPSSPQYLESLQDILNSGRHLQQLINDVLDLAKVEAGKIELRPESVDLSLLIGEVSAILRTTAASKGIQLETFIAPEVQQATLDPGRFKQVLYNYLSNALKFTPEGGTVVVRALPEAPGQVRLVVQDTGIGIAARDLGRLFIEFQQLDAGTTKRHAGTGLGLALTKRLVEAQGGSVGVESVLGQGSQFFAVLPLHAASSGRKSEPVSEPPPPGSGATVLVVDDDVRDRDLVVQSLTRAGYGVQVACTGGQALACCAERAFDAITLDLLLPDMTGLDVLHGVRLSGKNHRTPVVVLSVVAERCIVAGFSVQDYLNKPVEEGALLEALERAGVPAEKSGSILVVDDDLTAQRLMQSVLGKLGHEICCSPGGEEALAQASRRRPLAVILDLLMPEVDGFEFLQRFRAQSENQSVPVIVWTMKHLDERERQNLRDLAQRVIAKDDWTPTAFVSEVRRLIAVQTAPATSESA
ncbi:MAG: hypothetical protein RL685_277 [Pseudomonadota bacterium]